MIYYFSRVMLEFLEYQNTSKTKLPHICAQQLTESSYLVPSSPVAALET